MDLADDELARVKAELSQYRDDYGNDPLQEVVTALNEKVTHLTHVITILRRALSSHYTEIQIDTMLKQHGGVEAE